MTDATHTSDPRSRERVGASEAGEPGGTGAREMAGQVAFVTGGATGIGLATARALAARGATVAIFNRNQERAQQAVEGLRAAGGAAHAFATALSGRPGPVVLAITHPACRNEVQLARSTLAQLAADAVG